MKKLINSVDKVVVEQLEGMRAAHPELDVHIGPHYIVRKDKDAHKVAIISGGGSGHEPMHGGFVGVGMLDGACPGEVFTSPTPDQMYECGKQFKNGKGVLFIVKNYTGDVLSFESAAEMLHADGIKVQTVLVDDDVAVKDSLYTAGRRGVGLTVLMEKIVGAAAERYYDLDKLTKLAFEVSKNGRSMGMALTSCVVPAAGKPTFDLPADEVEIGIGIHGEPGQKRIKASTVSEYVKLMMHEILNDGDYTRTVRVFNREKGEFEDKEVTTRKFEKDDRFIVMVNGMGGTPVSELYQVYREVDQIMKANDMKIVRNTVKNYITSLDMQGFSITLLRVSSDEILSLWDAPVYIPAL